MKTKKKKTIAKNKKTLTKNKSKITKNKSKITKNKSNIAKNKSKITKNKSKITKNKSKITKNKSKITKNKSKITKTKSKITKNKSKITKNKSKITKNKKKIIIINPLRSAKLFKTIKPLRSVKLFKSLKPLRTAKLFKTLRSAKLFKTIKPLRSAKPVINDSKMVSIKEVIASIKKNNSLVSKVSIVRRSFSPSINNKLKVHSLKTLKQRSLNICDSLLQVNVYINDKHICLPFNDKDVQGLLLHNLRASKHLDVSKFIPPIQLLSNCWFNTMFVTFFFSDKGRKFFRFFRELMIIGKKIDMTSIPIEIAKIFFILNLFIEASYNQGSRSSILFEKLNSLTERLNTNYFVYHLYKIINKSSNSINPNLLIDNNNKLYDIPNIEDAGNPLTYYETILEYLKYDTLKLLKHNITKLMDINEVIQNKYLLNSFPAIPDIIILEDFQSGSQFNSTIKLVDRENNTYTYALDSIIITNKDHFQPDSNSHFVSVLTVNKQEYKFDGSSLSKLTPFKWKQMINKDKDWTFKEDPKYEPEVYNFTKGYKIMFYYRS